MSGELRLGMSYPDMLKIIGIKEAQRDALESKTGCRVESAVWVEFDLARDLVLAAMDRDNLKT